MNPALGRAAQDGTCPLLTRFTGCEINVSVAVCIVGETSFIWDVANLDAAKSVGAHSELVEGVEGANVAAPVLIEKRPAVAKVVWAVLEVVERMGSAQRGVEGGDGPVFVWTPALTIAFVAVETDVEGIKVASFIVVGGCYCGIGVGNVLQKAFGLNPSVLSASQAPSIVVQPVACFDLVDGFGGVGARFRALKCYYEYLVALAWNESFHQKPSTERRFNSCQH